MNHTHLLIASALILSGVSAMAQSHPTKTEEGSVKAVIGHPADSTEVHAKFVDNAPELYRIPGAPKFAIVGKNDAFYLGIGGAVKATVSYDFGSPIKSATMFTTSKIPMDPEPGNGGLLQFSAQQSNLFFNFVALPNNPNQIGAYISFNFINPNYGFNLDYAYLKYRGFTVGYTTGLFTDAAAAPPTIDYEGPCGSTTVFKGVVDYRHQFGKFGIGAGVEMPVASYTTSSSTSTVNQRYPDIPVYVQYVWDKSSHIRLSAILREMTYRDLISNTNHTATGWGIQLSGTAGILPGLTAYYQATYGQGLSSYFQDMSGLGLDMVPDRNAPGRLKTVKAWGGYAGLQYNITPKLFVSATYSQVRNYAPEYAGGETEWLGQYKYAQYAVGNVFYNITSNLQWGLEYIYGRRVDQSGAQAHDSRIQTMLQFSF